MWGLCQSRSVTLNCSCSALVGTQAVFWPGSKWKCGLVQTGCAECWSSPKELESQMLSLTVQLSTTERTKEGMSKFASCIERGLLKRPLSHGIESRVRRKL